jgi:hypothetical protein
LSAINQGIAIVLSFVCALQARSAISAFNPTRVGILACSGAGLAGWGKGFMVLAIQVGDPGLTH